MSLLPSFRAVRPHFAALGIAFALTQLPVAALLLFGVRPSLAGLAAYALASLVAMVGLAAVVLAWWRRIQRIVALVRGYAEHGQLPDAGDARGSVESVQTSLSNLDRLVRSLEADASRDPLTGIANRRACSARLEADLARARRAGTPLSIVLFDLDELKAINDRHGHAAGDAALRHLARTLEEAVREGDWTGRWGGDEFILGLWGADGEAAARASERVLAQIAARPLDVDGSSFVLGSSAGVAQAAPEDAAARLLARADDALFDAKRRGRGRVEVGS